MFTQSVNFTYVISCRPTNAVSTDIHVSADILIDIPRVATYPKFCVGEVIARPVVVTNSCARLIPVLTKLSVFYLLKVAHGG